MSRDTLLSTMFLVAFIAVVMFALFVFGSASPM